VRDESPNKCFVRTKRVGQVSWNVQSSRYCDGNGRQRQRRKMHERKL